MEQEATDELVCCQGHGLLSLFSRKAIVLVPERDTSVVERDEPVIGDGDPVGVARQIGQHGLRA